jgi:exonuclease III
MNINILTWNINKNESKSFYEELHKQLLIDDIHIVVLQECFYDFSSNEFAEFDETIDYLSKKGRRSVRIFIRKSSELSTSDLTYHADVDNKLVCMKIHTKSGCMFNLAGIHLYSISNVTKEQQNYLNSKFPELIFRYESRIKEKKTIVVGDFNYGPFDDFFQNPKMFFTNSDRRFVRQFPELQKKGTMRLFYNPMWNLVDGVIGSPEIMDCIDVGSIKILESLNGKPLIKQRINKLSESFLANGYSDHLPVSFTLKLN